MKYDPKIHHRHSIRVPGYDYSQAGYYFITCTTHDRQNLLGEIIDGKMIENRYGRIVHQTWRDLRNHYPEIELDEFCVMPNHVHGIIVIKSTDQPRHPLSEVVRGFKSFSARQINKINHTRGNPVWQRNYYEHIIRKETEFMNIRRYIQENPQNWAKDEENLSS